MLIPFARLYSMMASRGVSRMTLESNSVNQTPVEVDNSDMEEEEEIQVLVDNASINDSAIGFMKLIFEKNDDCLLSGEWLHIRCAAHVVNLIVQDGIKHVGSSIKSIRYAVKWIKKLGTRIEKFNKCARSARCDNTKSLVLDCPTRWNSTYNILEVAYEYKDAFARYDLEDVDFGLHIMNKGQSVPRFEDWVKAKRLCHFPKTFYDITLKISGTKYVTSHALVNELAAIRDLLRAQLDCDIHGEASMDKHLYDIATAMKPKFKKYYGEVKNMNLLVYFAFILDPRNKYEFLDVIVDDHCGREGISVVVKKKDYIIGKMKLLYEDYVHINAPSSTSSSTLRKQPRSTNTSHKLDHGDMLRRRMKMGQSSSLSTSELDKYNGEFYLLAIPISTVALESVFSTSGRVLDSFWSSLGDKTIECLICAQDWLRISLNLEKNEDMDTIVKIEKELMEQERACLND
ncbi:zinc finger BED domain-containing protein RICESLEEPER 2-like protein [Tanacetum coccineum]